MNTEKQKYYLIYQITNNINGKIYIGQHQTYNINDSYMGSGVHLQHSIQKYGIENFSKTILFQCSSPEEMNQKEAELVNEEFVKRDDTYNVIVGGSNGSWQKIHDAGLHKLGGINAIKKHGSPWSSFWNSLSDEEKIEWKKQHPTAMKSYLPSWKGKHHTEKTKQQISLSKRGKGCGSDNSIYGYHWIHNDELKMRICIPEDLLYWDYIASGWINSRGHYMTNDQCQKCKNKNTNKFKWINNGLIEKQIDVNDSLPDGFEYGKIKGKKLSQFAMKQRREKQQILKEQQYNILKPMLETFETEGFDAVVLKFNYKYTRNNLVQQFKKYIPEYIPNKHTKNTKAKQFKKIKNMI